MLEAKEDLLGLAGNTNKEEKAWNELQALLTSRISDVSKAAISNKTFDQITDEVIKGLS